MALKRPAETPSFEQYRDMMREEILDPLRIQLSSVEAKADEGLRGVAALQEKTVSIDGRLEALEAKTSDHAQSISTLKEKCEPLFSGCVPVPASGPGTARPVAGPSPGLHEAMAVMGGFERDTQRREIEAKATEIMTHLGAMPTIKKIYTPGKRASIAYIQFRDGAGGSAKDNLWAAFSSFREEQFQHEGKSLWFGPNKSKSERQVASFTARSLRLARLLDIDEKHLEGDFKQGIAWLGRHRFAEYSVNPDLPNVQFLCH